MTAIRDLASFIAARQAGLAKLMPTRPRIVVGMGACGSGNGAEGVMHAFSEAIDQRGLDVDLVCTGCFGFCAEEPLANVRLPGQPLVILRRVQVNHVEKIKHIRTDARVLLALGDCAVTGNVAEMRNTLAFKPLPELL
jgi:Ni,Fe-hydrogenase III small subunit